jgi:hypothetical protein
VILNFYSDAYMSLVNAVPGALLATNPFNLPIPAGIVNQQTALTAIPPKPTNRTDFPNVKFWTRQDWNQYLSKQDKIKSKEKKPARGTENVGQTYIEDIHGKVISADRATAIRQTLRQLWREYELNGSAPTTWDTASHEVSRDCTEKMVNTYPELGLCEDNWKLHYLCTKQYPGWVRSNNGKKVSVKEELSEGEDADLMGDQSSGPSDLTGRTGTGGTGEKRASPCDNVEAVDSPKPAKRPFRVSIFTSMTKIPC